MQWNNYMHNIIRTIIFCCMANVAWGADTITLPSSAISQSAMLRNWQAQKWDTSTLAGEFKSDSAVGTLVTEINTELEATDKTIIALDEVKTKPQLQRKTARQIIDRLQKHENKFESIRKELSIKRKELESHDQQSERTQKINKLYQLISSITRIIHSERQNMIKTML